MIRHLFVIFLIALLSKTAFADLIPASSAAHKLPEHWRSYWLDESEFDTRMFVTDTGKISAPVVMLVHGLGQNGLRDWLPIVSVLEKEYRVVLLDLPGFANSPTPVAKLSPARYARLLHFVKTHFSNKPISIVGHSMGGAVTLAYAHQYPEDIKQIALIDVAGILQRTAFVKHSATDRIPINTELLPNPLLSYVIGLQDISNHMIEKMLRLPDPTVWLNKSELAWGMTLMKYPNINAALSLVEENFAAAIFEQKKPVFILWGGKDLVAPLRTGELLSANLAHSEFKIISDAAHVPMASHPQQVSQWLLEKFNTQPPLKNTPTSLSTTENYECNNPTAEVLRGQYATILLNECNGILLDGVIAKELIVKNSLVEIKNSYFVSDEVSLNAVNSAVVMTGSSVKGTVQLNNSRADFAGVYFTNETPFKILQKSRLILSVCQAGNRYLHDDIKSETNDYNLPNSITP